MNFLITGASGQLGREWVRFLDEKKISYQAFSSSEMDITDRQNVHYTFEKVRPDVVVNCAAYTNVDGAESESEQAFLVNEKGVENLARACASVNAKLIHYSTDYVFSGDERDQKKYPAGYPEEAETRPVNVYGKSKEAGEKILRHSNCEWMLIRVSWLCGRFGNNFVKTMLRLGAERDELKVVDDQIGSPSLAFDVVEKTVQLIDKKMKGIFHISCEGRISWADFAEEIFKHAKADVTLQRISSEKYAFIATRPMCTLLSKKKIKEAGLNILDWKPGVRELLQQIKEAEN